ncbi:MAG: hypothetical protein NVS1B2_25360 [Vulcanimicrobiaceae bacterium]
MRFARYLGGCAALCAFATAAFVVAGVPARSFDLQGSAVTVKRPAADITDTYFFPSPTNANNVVAVMDVYPLIAQGAGLTTFFDPSVLYTMKFDNRFANEASNGGRPVENLVIQFTFAAASDGSQQVFVYGPTAPSKVGVATTLVNGGFANGSGVINRPFTAAATSAGTTPFSVFAGARRDPAFFNASQFFNIFPDRNMGATAASCLSGGATPCPQGFTPAAAGASNDRFATSNVLSIVVELPKTALVAGNGGACGANCPVAYWATTSTASGN